MSKCIFWSSLPCFDPQVTNLGRRGFQSIFKNLASYIWSETIQAQRFVAKSKCQASSRNNVELRIAKVYNWSKYVKKSKSSQKLDLVFQKIRVKYKICRWTKIKLETTIRVAEIRFETRRRGSLVKFEIKLRSTTKRKWNRE